MTFQLKTETVSYIVILFLSQNEGLWNVDVECGLRMQDGGKIQSFASLGLANRRAQQPAKKHKNTKKTNTEKTNTQKTNTKKTNTKRQTHKRQIQKRQTQERHAQKNSQNLSWSDQSPWRRGAREWQTQEISNYPTKRTRVEGKSQRELTNHRACF